MTCKIFTLNINNYFPEMTELTFPLMENYSNKIGGEFIQITERKFPDWGIHFEKAQIWYLMGDFNMFVDADVLIHPDFLDITKLDPNYVYLKDGYRANIKFLPNEYFRNDSRNQGISSCFICNSIINKNIWKPLDMTPDEVNENIIISKDDIKRKTYADFYQDEYLLSYNLAKYKIKYNGIDQQYIYHSYTSNDKNIKIREIKDKLKEWGI